MPPAARFLGARPYGLLIVTVAVASDPVIPSALTVARFTADPDWPGHFAPNDLFCTGQQHLPDGLDFIFPQGQSLDGQYQIQLDRDAAGRGGVPPDHRVPLDEAAFDAAFRQGRDVILEAAVGWIRKGAR